MPELPEVEVLCRHLAPRLKRRRIVTSRVLIPRVIRPLSARSFATRLSGATFTSLERRGKYLRMDLTRAQRRLTLIAHLGMTGRLYLLPRGAAAPPHAAIQFDLGTKQLLFEDPRQFGRMTFDVSALSRLGPEPLDPAFTLSRLRQRLGRSQQSIKVRLMDQSVLAGVGNIYASEVLFEAGIGPHRRTRTLSAEELKRLHRALQRVLRLAVRRGSTIALDFSGRDSRDKLFYFGSFRAAQRDYKETLRVYGRQGQACVRCQGPIHRLQQAGRSTFHCPRCQR